MFCTAKGRLLQRKTWHIAAPFAVLCLQSFLCFGSLVFRWFLCFGVICNPPNYAIRICNPLKPLRLVVNKKKQSIGLQILIIRTGGLQIRRNKVCCVSVASVFRRFLCFGVICNPPNYAIRICNPLKPLRLAVCKQGIVNRIANPYNKNRRITNPPEHRIWGEGNCVKVLNHRLFNKLRKERGTTGTCDMLSCCSS